MKRFKNPILPGFYPDPSIVRVEEDYYMVNSSFSYFPGVPIFHSQDLVHWNQIGNILDREEQIPLSEGGHSMGIFAPTIRYHEGLFYMITTNVCNGGNFIVTAQNPAGPWSNPYWLGSEGIDPSLFFDQDGRCYYCGTKDRREGSAFFGDNEIYVQELDLESMTLIGESWVIWHGALKETAWAEGPHIYRKDDYYYLIISEGGTGHEHAVSVARSKSIRDYFEGHKANPVLTHRHLGKNYPIVNVGHPDIVETQKGDWWMVLLASRPYGGYYRNLGRETFLVPMTWEEGWPVINVGVGKVEEFCEIPDLPYYEMSKVEAKENFDSLVVPKHFLYWKNPDLSKYSLEERRGYLRMYLSTHKLNGLVSPSLLVRRQQSMSYTLQCKFEFNPLEGEKAGVCLFQSNEFYYNFYVTLEEKGIKVRVGKCYEGQENTIFEKVLQGHENPKNEYFMKVHAYEQDLSFSIKTSDSDPYEQILSGVDGRILSTDVAGGFVGTCVGMFAESKNISKNYVDFDWFQLENRDV